MLTNNPSSAPCATWRTLAADPRRVNAVNFVAIFGNSRHGKTSLARALSKIDGFLWVHSDTIFDLQLAPRIQDAASFLSFAGEAGREHFNIGKYVDSDAYDHKLFVGLLADELRRRLQEAPTANVVLLDGYVFKRHECVFSDLVIPPERKLTLQTSVINGRYMVDNFDVTNHHYDQVLAHIRQTFRTGCLETTIAKSKYQNFATLGVRQADNKATDSDTTAKYDASKLDSIIRPLDRFADIGCNAGYFCFRVAENTCGAVVGVDMARHWLEIASHINNSIFQKGNVLFLQSEAVEFLSQSANAFDVIHCASTYHYFRDRQIEFLRSAHSALSPGGRLIVEVELAEVEDAPVVVQRSRGVDSTPCSFPNRKKFLDQIRDLFHVEAEFSSAFQRGSFYPRMYFHLRRA